MVNKAVFLDRDGVINIHRNDYVKSTDEFQLLPDVTQYLQLLTEKNFKLIIITNQSVVGRGLSTEKKLSDIHQKMQNIFKQFGFQIDKIYCCMHVPEDNCSCRKPGIELFEKAIKEFDIDIHNSWLIGDNQSDIQAGEKIGCKTILVKTNSGLKSAVERILTTVSSP